MCQTAYSIAHGVQARTLERSFVEGVSWPIDPASLNALVDLGLNVQQIARYFSVTPQEVIQLLDEAGRQCYIPVT